MRGGEDRGAEARERILQAADELFGERGFDATSTREISERSGINKALIHYHFGNKDGLLDSLLDRYYDRLAEVPAAALKEGGDMRDRAWRLIDSYMDFIAHNVNFARIVQREAAAGRHLERIKRRMAPLFDLGTGLLREAFPQLRSGPMAAEQLLVSFYGVIISAFTYSGVVEPLFGVDPLQPEAIERRKAHVRRLLEIILDAVERGETGGPP